MSKNTAIKNPKAVIIVRGRAFFKKLIKPFFRLVLFIIGVFFLTNYYALNDAILKVIFIGLASLTFPHILLEYLLEKNEK